MAAMGCIHTTIAAARNGKCNIASTITISFKEQTKMLAIGLTNGISQVKHRLVTWWLLTFAQIGI